jgi:hypothetical protein
MAPASNRVVSGIPLISHFYAYVILLHHKTTTSGSKFHKITINENAKTTRVALSKLLIL